MPPLDYRVIQIPLGGGVDLKRDAKQVKPDKALTLENATLQQIDTATKRHGYTALSRTVLESAGGRTVKTGHTLAAFDGALERIAKHRSWGLR